MRVKRALSLTAMCVQKQLGRKYTIGPNKAYGLIVFLSAKTSINDSLWMSPFECFLHSWWSIQRAKSYSEKKNTDFDVWHFHLHQRLTAPPFLWSLLLPPFRRISTRTFECQRSHAIIVGEKKAKPFTRPGLNPSASPRGLDSIFPLQQQPQPLPLPSFPLHGWPCFCVTEKLKLWRGTQFNFLPSEWQIPGSCFLFSSL